MKLLIQIPVNRCVFIRKDVNDKSHVNGILFFMNGHYREKKLTLIRKTNKGKGIYLCGHCGNEKELLNGNAQKDYVKSCGCLFGTWSDSQIDILKNNFPNLELISKLTGKSLSAIKDRAKKFNLYHAPIIEIWYERVPLEVRAYLAGHFDGEGCASFRMRKEVRSQILSVGACYRPVFDLYKKYFNGNLTREKDRVGRNKVMYRWKLVGYEDVYNFILSVLPFSLEKRDQLLCLKKYMDAYISNGKKTGFDESFKNLSIELHNKCTQLKRL